MWSTAARFMTFDYMIGENWGLVLNEKLVLPREPRSKQFIDAINFEPFACQIKVITFHCKEIDINYHSG